MWHEKKDLGSLPKIRHIITKGDKNYIYPGKKVMIMDDCPICGEIHADEMQYVFCDTEQRLYVHCQKEKKRIYLDFTSEE